MEQELEIEGLPEGARVVHAYGTPSSVSLSEEYRPTAERYAAFVAELRRMDEAERQSAIDDRDIRL